MFNEDGFIDISYGVNKNKLIYQLKNSKYNLKKYLRSKIINTKNNLSLGLHMDLIKTIMIYKQ